MFHKPFIQIENNEHIYGTKEALPYHAAALIYEKLCLIADLLEGKQEILSPVDDFKATLESLKSNKKPEAKKRVRKPSKKAEEKPKELPQTTDLPNPTSDTPPVDGELK